MSITEEPDAVVPHVRICLGAVWVTGRPTITVEKENRPMSGCCDGGCSADALRDQKQRRTLRVVLAINAVMFVVIAGAAIHSGSTALLADSLDNFGDALTYGLSLYAVARGTNTKAKVALFKGLLILAAALVVLAQIASKIISPAVPIFEVMGLFSLIGLAANSVCVFLLWRHRHEDVNMSSVWECSRNDIASNISVFLAAGAVWLTDSGWPDIVVALALFILLLRSAMRVISSAVSQLKAAT